MAFELEREDSRRLHLMEDGSLASVVQIGADLEQETVYTLTVTLDVGVGVIGYELRFWISEIHANGQSVDLFSGLETWFIAREWRPVVFGYILDEISDLVSLAKPDSVTIFTVAPDLPPKAVLKYERVCAHFEGLGFAVRELDSQYGFRAWRLSAKPINSA